MPVWDAARDGALAILDDTDRDSAPGPLGFRRGWGPCLLEGMRMQRSTPASTASPAVVALPQPSWAAQRTAAFRDEQDALMRGELSPLARIGYAHLPLVRTALTPDPEWRAVGATRGAADRALPTSRGGECWGGLAHAHPAVRLDGKPVTEAVLSKGQVIALGLLRFLVAGSHGIRRLRSTTWAARRVAPSPGCITFPAMIGIAWRLGERYPQPRPIRLAASRGEDKELQTIGTLHFTLPGPIAEHGAYLEQPGSAPVSDLPRCDEWPTGGSYGAGRFLYAR